MTKDCLLSIISTNKNDKYHQDQVQRTKFIINYFIYTLKKLKVEEKIEYILVDWGSDDPFSNYFHKELKNCSSVKFINVPKKETIKCDLVYDTSKALNIGIDNCIGENVLLTSPDQFLPLSIFNNLINLLESPKTYGLKGDEYKLVPRKFLHDNFFIFEDNMEQIDSHLLSLNNSAIPYPQIALNSGGGAGGNLLKRKQLIEIGGIKDTEKHNVGQDIIIFHEITRNNSYIDTSTFGSFLFKLPRTISGFRQTQLENVKNPLNYLKFTRDQKVIDKENITVVDNFNPPEKITYLTLKKKIKKINFFKIKEICKTIIDCSYLANDFGIDLDQNDIKFILNIKKAILDGKLRNIVLDERQAIRFASCLTSKYSSLRLVVILNSKNNPLEVVKFRNKISYDILYRNPKFCGNITVMEFNKDSLKNINNLKNVCIIQEEKGKNSLNLKNEFSFFLINSIRKSINNKKVEYIIESELNTRNIYNIFFTSKFFIKYFKSTYILYRKIRKILGSFLKKFITC